MSSLFKICVLSFSTLNLLACDSKNQQTTATDQQQHSEAAEKNEILPFLNIQQARAKYALPFCEKSNCIEMDIQTIQTQDAWINHWVEQSQAKVIQDQIGMNKALSLQQAVNAYVKKSDAWQAEFNLNKAYELQLNTRIAAQRNQYVLLQISVDSKQQGVRLKDRGYFFVADRKLKKKLSILDIIEKNQQNTLNDMIQVKYAEWITEQSADVQKTAPKKLYWGQSDWFFDGEGIGLHYRGNEIIKDAQQLDLYLTKAQTQKVLKKQVFVKMF